MSAVPPKSRLQFKPARREHKRLRLALAGPWGCGKTYSALCIASVLGQRIALIDTESGSSDCYAHNMRGEGGLVPFDAIVLGSYEPALYIEAIEAAAAAGYDVLIIDGLSPAWAGPGGALDQVDHIAARSQSNNKFFAWRTVTPQHNALLEAIRSYPGHVIATMRVKVEYVIDDVQRDGKWQKVPRRIGLAPIQREGIEHEFDIVGDMTGDHELIITKSRASRFDGCIIDRPGVEFGEDILDWLREGDAPSGERAPRAMPAPRVESTSDYEGRGGGDGGRSQRRYESGPRYDARRRPSDRPRHSGDARRPAQPAPSAPRDTTNANTAPTEPTFRFRDWGGDERWHGRLIREADANVIKAYLEAMHWARESPKYRQRLGAMQEHEDECNAVLRAIYAQERAASEQHDQRDPLEPNGADPLG